VGLDKKRRKICGNFAMLLFINLIWIVWERKNNSYIKIWPKKTSKCSQYLDTKNVEI
jgi:hypothetical protein